MRTIRFLTAATLLALAGAAQAAPGQDVNLDGSARTHKKAALSATADRQLQRADVPSAKVAASGVKAKADADMAARDGRARGPRLQVQRRNLKGDDAARALAQRANPNTVDRATAYGDKDHTEQVTDLKVTIKK